MTARRVVRNVRLSPDELARVEAAARAAGSSVHGWMKSRVLADDSGALGLGPEALEALDRARGGLTRAQFVRQCADAARCGSYGFALVGFARVAALLPRFYGAEVRVGVRDGGRRLVFERGALVADVAPLDAAWDRAASAPRDAPASEVVAELRRALDEAFREGTVADVVGE